MSIRYTLTLKTIRIQQVITKINKLNFNYAYNNQRFYYLINDDDDDDDWYDAITSVEVNHIFGDTLWLRCAFRIRFDQSSCMCVFGCAVFASEINKFRCC